MFWIDYWYVVLVLPALLFTVVAQIVVKSTFARYSRVPVHCALTGREASRLIQQHYGLNVPVQPTAGELTDHYDPSVQTIRLSQPVYDAATVAAVGVAAHETGHAIQYAEGYFPIRLRMAIVPVTRFGSGIAPYLLILGLVLSMEPLAMLGVACFGLALVFQLVTLPVEFNASRRAVKALAENGRLTEDELRGVRRVLTAAALTYVAAMLVSLMSFIRILLIVNGRNRRN